MKIALLPNLTRKSALQVSLDVCAELEKHGMKYFIKRDYIEYFKNTEAEFLPLEEMTECCDVVIAVGGDGTIIHAAKFGKPTLGINAGRIAFMAGLEPTELEMLSTLKSGEYEIDRRMMLRAEIVSPDGEILSTHYCVNDAVVARGLQIKMDDFIVEHNGKFLNKYTADGIIFSTPTGSTAYNLSAGGPIVEPDARNMIITPICAHDMASRCIVTSDRRVITVRMTQNARRNAFVSVDGGKSVRLNLGDTVTIRRSKLETKLLKLNDRSFYDVVNAKFQGK